ncbi:MAG TPA: DUF5916 domain-containing protein [Candidatus Polarisedimenticolia bacterium]|nr:DUF5916 domain-containing protein [Candidatus Polarisedimenticolia bacterium]
MDGVLDEEAWRQAGVIPDLVQQSPRPGEPTPYHTEIRFLVDDEALYLGITCLDPEPGQIVVHTLQRDGDFSGDDSFAVVLDTFGDRRNGYLFRINAAGARQDGLISGTPDVSLDWDGVWDARTRKTPTGWTAEIEIPSRTLRFSPSLSAWGLEAERNVARDRVVLRWSGTTLDSFLSDLRRAGRLEGIEGLKQGRGLSVSPYGLVRSHRDLEGGDAFVRGDAGLDVTYNFTPELAAVVTANTDFAETEVDTRQINLTRFDLFFPEKRPFFLEGSNLFDFALGLETDFIPFFSRRVGLLDQDQIPLDAGAKLLGHAGRWGIAVLDVKTGEAPPAPATNLFAGRATFDASDHLRLGALVTRGNPDGVHENLLGGLDAVWRTSSLFEDKNLSLSAWGARSGGDPPESVGGQTPGGGSIVQLGRRGGWGVRAEYPNDLWYLSLAVNQFDDALDPGLGFLPRPGTRFYRGGAAYQPRPSGGPFGWVRQFFFECYPTRVDDLNGDPESWRVFVAPFNVETRSGEHLEANWAPQFEWLDVPFEVAPGVVIPPGRYHFTRYRTETQSSPSRPWRVGSTVWFGDFFDGRLTQWNSFAQYSTPAGRLQLEADGENDFGHLPEGDFIDRLLLLKAVYAFSPSLLLSVFTQYDSVDSPNLGLNARLRWTFHPGDDLFVVWTHDWDRLDSGERFSFGPKDDQGVVKLRWTFRR